MRHKKMLSLVFSLLLFSVFVSCGVSDPPSYGSSPALPSDSPSPPKPTGSVTLAWEAPTTYTDNSPLTPAGYYIYYGPFSFFYTHAVDVGNVTKYTIDELSKGTYYFAITVYDADGNESDFSQPEISADI